MSKENDNIVKDIWGLVHNKVDKELRPWPKPKIKAKVKKDKDEQESTQKDTKS